MTPETFERARLSKREDEILEAAIEGMTDIQISQRMGITQSTVNSYWVRIRGKLGQLSRTELVALALKQKAREEMEVANAQLAALRLGAESHAQNASDQANAETFRAALAALPEAIVVWGEGGAILFANRRLEAMFGYEAGALVGQPVSILVPKTERALDALTTLEFMREPRAVRVGIGNVVYGCRRIGTPFRIVLLLDGAPTSAGPLVTCVVRDFASEIQTRKEFTMARG